MKLPGTLHKGSKKGSHKHSPAPPSDEHKDQAALAVAAAIAAGDSPGLALALILLAMASLLLFCNVMICLCHFNSTGVMMLTVIQPEVVAIPALHCFSLHSFAWCSYLSKSPTNVTANDHEARDVFYASMF